MKKIKLDPLQDGITHINIYSKGKTDLGRFLSNFAYSPIRTEDGDFASIEGYWYWLSCKDDNLRTMYGWRAKSYGREFGGSDWCDEDEFKRKILDAIEIKVRYSDDYYQEFTESALPFVHYYVYNNKVVEPKDGKWIWQFLTEWRTRAQKQLDE